MVYNREQGNSFFDEDLASLIGSRFGEDFGSINPDWKLAILAEDSLLETVSTSDGLDSRMRMSVVMGILIALRQTEELKLLTDMALKSGWTLREIEKVLCQVIPCVGLTSVNLAKEAIIKVFNESAGF